MVDGQRGAAPIPEERLVMSGDVHLHVVDWRNSAAVPLLGLHGITANARAFDGLAWALLPDYGVIAPDLRGRGESDTPAGPYGVETHAGDALAVLDALEIARTPVVGWSLGALVALALAARAPERVSRVVLLDPPLAALSDAAQASLGRVQGRIERDYGSLDEALAATRSLDLLGGNWDAGIEAFLRADLVSTPDGRVRHRMRPETLAAERAALLPSFPRIMPKVRCPVLILRAPGALFTPGDQTLTERAAVRATRLFPQARTIDIPATNHYTILLGAPAAMSAAVRAFLDEDDAGQAQNAGIIAAAALLGDAVDRDIHAKGRMMTATLDTSTDRGTHVAARLRDDEIAWLTTVRASGQPDSVPVWFLWDGETILVYSQPHAPKVTSIAHNPKVSLAVDDTKGGGDVIRIEGIAELLPDHPPAHEVPAYLAKYASGIEYIGYEPATFAQAYSAAIRITPTRYRT